MTTEALVQHVEHFRWRVMCDAIQEATASYWTRRADVFAAVGTPVCDLIASNCRHHAWLISDAGLDADVRRLISDATPSGDEL